MDNTAKDFAHKIVSELKRISGFVELLITNAPREHDKEAVRYQYNTQQNDDSTGRERSTIAELGPAPQHPNNSQRKWYKSLPWKKWLKTVGVIAGIGYAIVTYCQWRDAGNNFRIDQRAWIGATSIGPIPAVGKPLTVTIMFRNTGKTPAIKVSPYYNYQFVKKGAKFRFDVKRTYGNELVAPNADAPGTISLADGRIAWSQTDDLRARAGDIGLYFFGQIWYADIFKREHWLRFCYLVEPIGNTYIYISCNEYNDTDDND
jgi:hypothetical protein